MDIAFVKTGGSHDRVHVRRRNGTETSWRWPAAGPPHDLVHWAVESELGIDQGFWGRIAAGRDPASVGGGWELMLAEALVNSIQTGLAVEPRWSDAECLSWAATWAGEGGAELPDGIEARYDGLRTEAESWIERYRRLEPRTALEVAYPIASRKSEAARSGG